MKTKAEWFFGIVNAVALIGALIMSIMAYSTANTTLRAAYVPWVHMLNPKIVVSGEKFNIDLKIENKSNAPALGLYLEGYMQDDDGKQISIINGRSYDESLLSPNSVKEFKFDASIPTEVYKDILDGKVVLTFGAPYKDAFGKSYSLIQGFRYREGELHPVHTEIRGLDQLTTTCRHWLSFEFCY